MNWEQLYDMQKKLDTYIQENHDLEGRDLFAEKYLALLVEIGELANETRCYKFWSNNKRSEYETSLGEFVDGIHFLLSIGLEKNYFYHGEAGLGTENSETAQFNKIFTAAATFKVDPTFDKYSRLFKEYLTLGELLG